MLSWRTSFLCAAIVAGVSVQPSQADPIVVGAPGDAGYCIPFGCQFADRYQQVYSAGLFPGTFTISAITFPYTLVRNSDRIDPAAYTLRLSTTRAQVGHLSSNFDSNVGTDATNVFAGALAGEVPFGGGLSFTLPVPFMFDPRNGNLLLDVFKQGGIFSPAEALFLDFSSDMNGASSSAGSADGRGFMNPFAGLVTAFSGDGLAPVPEPATMLLFATATAGGLLMRRRRCSPRRTPTQ
jgi:hypothetical protein